MDRISVDQGIYDLVEYGMQCGLIDQEDRIYCTNQLLEIFKRSDYQKSECTKNQELEAILVGLLDYACETDIISNTVTERDLFDTRLVNVLLPKPSQIIGIFNQLYQKDSALATEFYYKFSQDSDYIRRYRIKKDKKWTVETGYGMLDITINLSKPEKDPKAIAAAKHEKQRGYPKCLLCKENEGYAGRINHPARHNHRIIPVIINNSEWGFQYSPYVYYNEHCIVFNGEHTPMKIDRAVFVKLFDFVRQFPHYFVGSNADLPIVGGSILSHDHFQGGNYEFPMAKAEIETTFEVNGFRDIEAGIVKWPMSVIRLRAEDTGRLVELADQILSQWRQYFDPEVHIYAKTDGEPHNTITPIARKRGKYFELDLVLRNNLTTKEHPFGLYHPHEELHHIKKENIGLIEVMGLAVLPARLLEEMEQLAACIRAGKEIDDYPELVKHADWFNELRIKYNVIPDNMVEEILEKEIGLVFLKVLEHSGVFKRDETGKEAMHRFISQI